MTKIDLKVESRYLVDREEVKKAIREQLAANGAVDNWEVSVVICGERKMRLLQKKYLKDYSDDLHDVLSFPLEGAKSPEGQLWLGDIVICYPVAREDAGRENMRVDEKITELAQHACLHLLGIHHEE